MPLGSRGGGFSGRRGEAGEWPGGQTILLGGSSVYSVVERRCRGKGARGISPEAAYPLRREIESRRFRGPSGARLRVRLETIIGRNSIPRALRGGSCSLSLSLQLIAIDQHDDGGKETFTIENIPNWKSERAQAKNFNVTRFHKFRRKEYIYKISII